MAEYDLAPAELKLPEVFSKCGGVEAGLVDTLAAAAQDRVRAGTVPPHGVMRYLVPFARANKAQGEQLLARIGETRVSDLLTQRSADLPGHFARDAGSANPRALSELRASR